jgi:hypothetical protein
MLAQRLSTRGLDRLLPPERASLDAPRPQQTHPE